MAKSCATETKSLQRRTEVPWRLHFQTLGVALFHGHLKKVRVTPRVYGKLILPEIGTRIGFSRGDVHIFYVADITMD
jgi:hypothetical protein